MGFLGKSDKGADTRKQDQDHKQAEQHTDAEGMHEGASEVEDSSGQFKLSPEALDGSSELKITDPKTGEVLFDSNSSAIDSFGGNTIRVGQSGMVESSDTQAPIGKPKRLKKALRGAARNAGKGAYNHRNIIPAHLREKEILDEVETGSLGIGLRLLDYNYSGPCIRIETYDGEEYNIGFWEDDLDWNRAELLSRGLPVKIAAIFDQSGGGYVLSQSDSAKRPLLDIDQKSVVFSNAQYLSGTVAPVAKDVYVMTYANFEHAIQPNDDNDWVYRYGDLNASAGDAFSLSRFRGGVNKDNLYHSYNGEYFVYGEELGDTQWTTYSQYFSSVYPTHLMYVNNDIQAVNVYSSFGNVAGNFVLGGSGGSTLAGEHFFSGQWRETVVYPRILIYQQERPVVEAAAVDYWNNLQTPTSTYEEIISTATGAFSLRKANPAYSGPALRVKFDSQSGPEFDIGFDGDGVDWTGLSAIFNSEGASEARVARLYNQMVDGGYISEATYSKMPVLLIQYKTMNFAGGQGLTGPLIDHVDAVSLVTAGVFLQLDQPDNNVDYFVMLGDQNNVNQKYMALARSSDGWGLFDNPKNSYYSVDRTDIFEGDVIEGFKGHVFAQVFEEGGAKQHRLYKNEIEDTTVEDYNSVGTITGLLNVGRHNSDNHHLMGNMNEILVFDRALSPEQVSVVSSTLSLYHGVYPLLDTQDNDILEVTNPNEGIKPLPFANTQFFEYEIYENGTLVETLTQSDPVGFLSLAPLGNLSLDTVYEARIRANLGNYVTMYGPPRSFRITSDVLFDPMLLGPSLWFDLQDQTQLLEDSLDSSKVMALINKTQPIAVGNEALINGGFQAFTNNQPDHWTITDASGGSNSLHQDSPLYIGQTTTSPISMYQENLITGQLYMLEINTDQLVGEIQVRGTAIEDVYYSITASGLQTAYFIAKDKRLSVASASQNTSAIILSVSVKEVSSLYAAQYNSSRQPSMGVRWDRNFLRLERSFTSNQDQGLTVPRSTTLENQEMSWAFVYQADSIKDEGQSGGIAKGLPWAGNGSYAYKLDFLYDSIRLYLWDGVADGSGNEHDFAQILIPDERMHVYQFSVSASEILYSIDGGTVQSVTRQHSINFSNQHDLQIGSRPTGTHGMNGLLGDVLYFDKALNDADMLFLAEGLISRNNIGKEFDPMPLSPTLWIDPNDEEVVRIDANRDKGFRGIFDKSRNLEIGDEMFIENYFVESFWNSSQSNWTAWTATGSTLVGNGFTGILRRNSFLTTKQTYECTMTVTRVSGSVGFIYSGWGSEIQFMNSSGTFTRTFNLHGTTLSLWSSSFVGTIHSISLKPVHGIHVNEREYDWQFLPEKIRLNTVMRGRDYASISSLHHAVLDSQVFSVMYISRLDDHLSNSNGAVSIGQPFSSPAASSWRFEFTQGFIRGQISDGTNQLMVFEAMVDSGIHLYEMAVTNDVVTIFEDGIEIKSEPRGGLQINYTGKGISIGDISSSPNSINGDFGDVLYFNRTITSSERQQLSEGLLNKYYHTWADLMLASYLSINKHAEYQQESIDALEAALQPGGYYHETFGPNGQNKTRCDFLLMFELEDGNVPGGPSTGDTTINDGETLRWEIQGEEYWEDIVPTHTDNGKTKVAIVSSTDAWAQIQRFIIIGQTMTGPLPLVEMPAVTKFYTGSNSFSGTMPKHKIPNCSKFYAYINQFSGDFPLLEMPNLVDFRVQYNQFTSFPDFNFPLCDSFRIYTNQVTGPCPNVDFPLLETLSIHQNQMTGAAPTVNSPNLHTYNISENNFDSYTSQSWPDSIWYFYANDNPIGAAVVDQMLNDLTSNVATRDKMVVRLMGTGVEAPSSPNGINDLFLLSKNGHQVTTNADWEDLMVANYLYGNSHADYQQSTIDALHAALQPGSDLHNIFGPSGQNKTSCDFLLLFELETGSLLGPSQDTIVNSATSLRWDIQGATYTSDNVPLHTDLGNGGIAIVSSENSFTGITRWGIDGQGFSGPMPKLNLPVATVVRTGRNAFSGSMPLHLLPLVQYFYTQDCSFSGNLPEFDFPEIIDFRFHNNQFSGTFPDFNFPKVKSFRIYGNQFTGPVPEVNFPLLETLNISANDFSGNMPTLSSPHLISYNVSGNLIDNYISQTWPETIETFFAANISLDTADVDQILANLKVNVSTRAKMDIDLTGSNMGAPSSPTGVDDVLLLSQNGHEVATNLPWADAMLADYIYRHSHGTYPQAVLDEFHTRLSSGYLYDTFGPNGQDKTECDFVYLMQFNGPTVAPKIITKAGDQIRWDMDGTVYVDNRVPTHPFDDQEPNPDPGICTFSSTDGWVGMLKFRIEQNPFTGVLPNYDFPAVQEFYFYSNNFTGTCPNFNFPVVEKLVGYYNEFSGEIPDFDLPELVQLYLSYSGFSGECPPFNLPKCTNLAIHGNNFTGACPNFDMPQMGNFTIYLNNFSGPIPNFNFPLCRFFYVDRNNFSGTMPNFNFPEMVAFRAYQCDFSGPFPALNFPLCSNFRIHRNNFSGNFPAISMPLLVTCYISENSFTGAMQLLDSPNLDRYYVYANQFSSYSGALIGTNLTQLFAEGNQLDQASIDLILSQLEAEISTPRTNIGVRLTGTSMASPSSAGIDDWYALSEAGHNIEVEAEWEEKMLANYLYRNSHGTYSQEAKDELLSRLSSGYLYDTFGPSGQNKNECDFVYLLEMAEGSTSSQTQYKLGSTLRWNFEGTVFTSNTIPGYSKTAASGNGIVTFSAEDGMDTMSYFNLGSSNFKGVCPKFDFPVITSFYLHSNHFTGDIPLFNFPAVEFFVLHTNSFTGQLSLFNFPVLEQFQVQRNQLTGTLPDYDFPEATHLWCHENNFTGTIPTLQLPKAVSVNLNDCSFDGVSNQNIPLCRDFYIARNNIAGTCPNFTLPAAVNVQLNENEFTGPLPDFDFPDCVNLYAYVNHFTALPTAAINLPKIQIFHLMSNEMVGSIPTYNFPLCKQFIISKNQLTGGFPTLNMPNLEYLNINENQLSGNIPTQNFPELVNFYVHTNSFTSIETQSFPKCNRFYVYNNDLTGACPNFTLPDVELFFLYSNNFTGTIPAFDLPKCENFHIANAGFSGTMPVINIPSATSLYVYSNAFSGAFPVLNTPLLQDLACNMNNFTGDLPDVSMNSLTRFQGQSNNFTGFSGTDISENITYFSIYSTNLTETAVNSILAELAEEATTRATVTVELIGASIAAPSGQGLDDLYLLAENGHTINTNAAWEHQMLSDYLHRNSHAAYSTATKDELLSRLSSGYLYDTFGPSGQNKTDCDFLYLFEIEAGGSTTQTAQVNTGADLRWDFDGTVSVGNTIPAYTQGGGGNGVVTITTTDSFAGITEFNLNSCSLTGPCPNLDLPAATQVHMSLNNMTGTLPAMKLPLVETFNITENELSGTIPAFDFPKVTTINLEENDFTGIEYMSLPELRTIYIRRNNITGPCPNFDFPKLGGFQAHENAFTGPVPDFNFPELTVLYIQRNQFDAPPTLAMNIPNVELFNVSENNMTGSIPAYDFPECTGFYMSINQLSGPVPVLNLPKVEYFYLHTNMLSGTFPTQSFPSLKGFRIYSNAFTGMDAQNFPLCTDFKAMYNNLAVPVPTLNLPLVQDFQIQGAGFTGPMPAYDFPVCHTFAANGCFSGTFPAGLNLPKVKIFQVYQSNFSGPFPSFNWPELESFKIYDNNFTGNLPEFGSNVLLKYDVDDNAFTGYTGTDLPTTLTEFDVAGNALTESAINAILAEFAEEVDTRENCIITLNQGTNAAPTGQGLNDLATLLENGHSVLSNAIWEDFMLASYRYRNSHGTLTAAVEAEFLARLTSGYLKDTFGPAGQNKTVCDFVYVLECGTLQTAGNGQTKTGDPLRWDFEGNVTVSNTMPAYTKQSNGVVTLSSSDGWSGMTDFTISSSNFVGTVPKFDLPNATAVRINANDFTGIIPDFNFPECLEFYGLNNHFTTLPTSAINLPKVEIFHLGTNDLVGSIPTYNFPDCKQFFVSDNDLTGGFPTLNMPNLEILYLSNNSLSGHVPTQNLPNMKVFFLQHNSFDSIDTQSFPECTNFYLTNNGILGACPNFNLPKVQNFYINNNGFIGTMPTFDYPLCKLFIATNNDFSGALSVVNVPAATRFYVDVNNFSGTFPTLNLPVVQHVRIHGNEFTGNLPDINTNTLQELQAYSNDFTGFAATDLPTSLTRYLVGGNNLSETAVNAILAEFAEEATTRTKCEINIYSGTNAAPTGQGIDDQYLLSENGHSVKTMAAWEVNMLGDYLKRNSHGTLPTAVKDELLARLTTGYLKDTFGPSGQDKDSCDFVYVFELGDNPTDDQATTKTGSTLRWDFEGNVTVSNTIPIYTKSGVDSGVMTVSSDDGWDGVTVFRIESCYLKGLLPNFSMVNLTSLWIRSNQFSGNLPVLDLPAVAGLYLSSNVFSGTFPILQTPILSTLHLQYNELSGAFPDVDYPECNYLSAHSNNFTSLPSAAVNLPKVEYFHFGLNEITGTIPGYNFPLCEYFAVYGNQLTGAFPTLNMPNLTALNLFSNQLSGTIPTVTCPNLVNFNVYNNDFTSIETQNFPMCTQFQIQSNNLTGACPNFTLPIVEQFWMQSNNFTGEMPAFDFPECTSFAAGGSGFSGNFPATLNIPKVEVFQIFLDGFSGNFPTFNWPELVDFRIYNNLFTSIDNQNFPKCEVFRIESNNLTGSLPNFTLPLVETFWAGANQLSGTLPALNFPNCTHFYIHSNQFSGAFPAMNMPDCEIFHIADNAFSGALPALTLPSVTAFYIFDNNFSGNFPALSLPNVIEFRIDRNGFTGNMPDVTAASLLVYMTYDNSFTDYVGTDIPTSVTTYSLQNNALSESAVNAVLAELAEESATRATCSINISGMTASGQGLTDIATLQGDGHTVTTG